MGSLALRLRPGLRRLPDRGQLGSDRDVGARFDEQRLDHAVGVALDVDDALVGLDLGDDVAGDARRPQDLSASD